VIVLDTNVISETVRAVPDRRVLAWLAEHRETPIFASVLSLGELRNGLGRAPPGARRDALEAWIDRFATEYAARLLPITAAVAARWGDLGSAAAKRGETVGAVDGLIAATAIEHGFAVATRNVADFEPTGVRIVDPWKH